MSTWLTEYGDQYSANVDVRYPEFSDVHSDIYLRSLYNPKYVTTPEDKYQIEQQRIPAYNPCRCGACSMSAQMSPAPRPPMRAQTIDEREKALYYGDLYQKKPAQFSTTAKPPTENVELTVKRGGEGLQSRDLRRQSALIIFLFFVILIMCSLYTATIYNLRKQLSSLATTK